MALGLAGLLAVAPNKTISADEPLLSAAAITPAVDSGQRSVATPVAFAVTLSSTDFTPARLEFVSLPSFDPMPPAAATPDRANPYGLETYLAPPGALWTKWRKVRADIDAAAPALKRCREDFRRCSPAARRFVAVVKQAARAEGRARLAIVNRRINAAVTYTSDIDQWQRDDVWSAPLAANKSGSFDTGKGDCEDYAIAKYAALREAGVAAADLQILVVKDTAAGNDHAALAARVEGQWLILDNRWSRLLEENEAAFFTPLFALDAEGVKRFGAREEQSARLKPRKLPMPALYAANRA
jgi:predicted transglutaminase-like cysteine proteinase